MKKFGIVILAALALMLNINVNAGALEKSVPMVKGTPYGKAPVNVLKDTVSWSVSFGRENINGCSQMVEQSFNVNVVKPGWLPTLAPFVNSGATVGAGYFVGQGLRHIGPLATSSSSSSAAGGLATSSSSSATTVCVPASGGGNLPLPPGKP